MLKNIIGKGWQKKTPGERSELLATLDPESSDDFDTLVEILSSEDDETVITSGLLHFRNAHALAGLRHRLAHRESLAGQAILARINQDHSSEFGDLDQATLSDLYLHAGNKDAASLLEPDTLTGLITSQDLDEATREKLLNQIDNTRLLTEIRNKLTDKKLKNLARDRMDAIKEKEKQEQESRELVYKVLQRIRRLSSSQPDNLYSAEVQVCHDDWQGCSLAATPDEQQEFCKLLETCQAKASEYTSEKKADDQARQLLEGFSETINEYCLKLEKEFDQSFLENTLPGLLEKLELDYIQLAKHNLSLNEQTAENLRRLQSALNNHRQIMRLQEELIQVNPENPPASLPSPGKTEWDPGFASHPALDEISKIHRKAKELRKQEDEKTRAVEKKIAKHFRFLQAEIRKKNIRASDQISRKLQSLVEKLPEDNQAGPVKKLDKLGKELAELKDWNRFASMPARESLCEKMEALAEANLKPMAKFQKIQALQQEWKQIYNDNPDDELGQRFKKAGDKAFEPCKAWFQERDKLQQSNLEKRKTLCDNLESFITSHNWDTPDWKQADRIYNKAVSEWKEYSPVNKEDLKPVQKRYNTLVKQLKEKLAVEKSANTEKRHSILEQAGKALEMEDVQAAIDQVKQLQSQWNQVGIVFHRENRELWNRFRSVCDEVFARRDKARQEKNREIDNLVDNAKRLVDSIRAYANSADSEPGNHKADVKELESGVKELCRQMPKGAAKKIEKSLNDALGTFRKSLSGIKQRQYLAERTRLRDQANWLASIEQQLMKGEAPKSDDLELIDNAAEDELFRNRIQEIHSVIDGKDANDIARDNTAAAQLLPIKMEIACDVESPPEYSRQRMDYQLELLTSKKGKPSGAEADIEALEDQWLSTGFISGDQCRALQERINTCLKAKKLL